MPLIIFVHLFNDRSGSPKILRDVINALCQEGHEAEVLTSSHSNGFLESLPAKKRFIFYKRSENKILTLFFYIISQVYLFFFCLRYIRKDAVFHINTLMPFGAAVAAFVMRKKVVYHIHETSIKPKVLKVFLRFIVGLTANEIIYVSKFLSEAEPFNNVSSMVIYNSVEAVESTTKLFCLKEFNVLMICSLKKYKGVDEFLRLASLFDIVLPEFKFVLVLNATKEEVDVYFSGCHRPSNLIIYSRQCNPSVFYKDADILVNLSRPDEWVETYGLTIVEGMSYGLPVIVPTVGGPSEIVTHGKEGYLISCYDLDKVKDCILLLASDKTLYSELSDSAKQRSLDFSPQVYKNNIINFYNERVF